MVWEYATLEISAVVVDGTAPESAEWQIYAIGPAGELLFESYQPYRVAWARVYAEHLNRLGRDGWEVTGQVGPQQALVPSPPGDPLVGVAPHVVETRFVLRRPAGPAAGSASPARSGQAQIGQAQTGQDS